MEEIVMTAVQKTNSELVIGSIFIFIFIIVLFRQINASNKATNNVLLAFTQTMAKMEVTLSTMETTLLSLSEHINQSGFLEVQNGKNIEVLTDKFETIDRKLNAIYKAISRNDMYNNPSDIY